ncbi:MAG TPA: hypothetical protein VKN14_13590 [Flavobacteriaceae bacterium]|nr:hypothetical protein [Flavobacteriaceae bacterium]
MDLQELDKQKKNKRYSRHPWEQARLEFIYTKIKTNLKDDRPVFLDIGCGDTFVAEQLLKKMPNSTFYCIDIAFTDEQLIYYSKKFKNKKIKVFNKLNEAIAQMESNISFVLVLDVIEHIENDLDFLIQIEQIKQLDSKSKIVITVPAFQNLFSHHDYVLGHYRRYNNKTLENITLKCGLQTIQKGYFFSSLLLPRFISKLTELIFKPKTKSTLVARWSKGKLITKVYKNILILDITLTAFLEKIHLKPLGLSNYIICKKHV